MLILSAVLVAFAERARAPRRLIVIEPLGSPSMDSRPHAHSLYLRLVRLSRLSCPLCIAVTPNANRCTGAVYRARNQSNRSGNTTGATSDHCTVSANPDEPDAPCR